MEHWLSVGLTLTTWLYTSQGQDTQGCPLVVKQRVIVVGANPSVTTVQGFHFTRFCPDTLIELQEAAVIKSFTPGLSSFANNTKKVGEQLLDILKAVESLIPDGVRQTTPVVVGMQGLQDLPGLQIEDLQLEGINVIRHTSFNADSSIVGVIDPVGETVLVWAAVNYLLGFEHIRGTTMVAVLDLKEDYFEVTIPYTDTEDTTPFHPAEYVKEGFYGFRLETYSVPLKVVSFLGLGLSAARLGVLSLLSSEGSTDLYSQCVHPKFNGTKFTINNTKYTLYGVSGDKSAFSKTFLCQQQVSKYFASLGLTKDEITKWTRDFALVEQFHPIATSGFTRIIRDAGLAENDLDRKSWRDKILHKAFEACSGDGNPNDPFSCLDLVYIFSLLQMFLRTQLEFIGQINNQDVSWAIGSGYSTAQDLLAQQCVCDQP